jgi:hypothetical protein
MTSVARFEAPWEGWLTATTFGSVVLVVAVSAVVGVAAIRAGNAVVAVITIVSCLPGFAAIGLCAWWSPCGYTVDGVALRIERPAGPVVVPRGSIVEVRALGDEVALSRVFGSGGLFGYFGQYREPTLGAVDLYATRRTGRVLVRTGAGALVLTPDRPEALLSALKAPASTR